MYPELLPSVLFLLLLLTGLSAVHSVGLTHPKGTFSQCLSPMWPCTLPTTCLDWSCTCFSVRWSFLPCSFLRICESKVANDNYARAQIGPNIPIFPRATKVLQFPYAHYSLFCTVITGTISTDWTCFPNSPNNNLPLFFIAVPWRRAKRWTTASNDQPKKRNSGCVLEICHLFGFDEAYSILVSSCCLMFIIIFFAFNVKPIEAFQCT